MSKGHLNKRTIHWMSFPGTRFYPFQLRAAKSDVLHRIGRWNDLTAMLEQDLAQARELEILSHQGRCLLKLGIIDAKRGNFAGAGEKIGKAQEKYRQAGDDLGVFECRSARTKIAINLEEYQTAESMALELLSEARQKKSMSEESEMLNNLGLIYLKTGRSQESMAYFSKKLELAKILGEVAGRAQALGNIGCVYYSNGQYSQAADCDKESIELCRRIGDVYNEYFALYNLARACEQMGKSEEALAYYRQDLEMARQLGDGPGEKTILDDMARLQALISKPCPNP